MAAGSRLTQFYHASAMTSAPSTTVVVAISRISAQAQAQSQHHRLQVIQMPAAQSLDV
jgi:hypothetical protein